DGFSKIQLGTGITNEIKWSFHLSSTSISTNSIMDGVTCIRSNQGAFSRVDHPGLEGQRMNAATNRQRWLCWRHDWQLA
ncbi:MAG: hypothetical protein ABI690_36590, partial [Chloroflexota bacterium]